MSDHQEHVHEVLLSEVSKLQRERDNAYRVIAILVARCPERTTTVTDAELTAVGKYALSTVRDDHCDSWVLRSAP